MSGSFTVVAVPIAFGGTSCAAPLWAGFTALVNQQAAINGHAPVGFINPAVYAIAAGPGYLNCFHDTTTGNNTWSGSPNLFYATNVYDLCTGLGTPNGTNLINVLAASVNPVIHLSPPPPPYGTNLAAMNGSNPNGTWSLFIQDDQAALIPASSPMAGSSPSRRPTPSVRRRTMSF